MIGQLLPPSKKTLKDSLLQRLIDGANPDKDGHPRSAQDQKFYEECRYDVAQFAYRLLPHYCTEPFSKMHQQFFEEWRDDAGKRNLRDATAAPRGNAKTTARVVMKALHDICYGHEDYIIVIAARFDMARDKVRDIQSEIDFNDDIKRVYGLARGEIWNSHDFIVTRPDGGQTRVRAASRGTQLRGILWRGKRPSKIIGDDLDHSDQVFNEPQREKMWRWFTSDILKLGRPGTNVDIVFTIQHEESLGARLLRTPGWRPHFYQSIIRWADQAPELWEQWRGIYTDPMSPPDEAADAAYDFFKINEEQMLAGHEVLWPERESYYDLMCMIVAEGETAFATEKMNDPAMIEERIFDMDAAVYFTLEPGGIALTGDHKVPWHEMQTYAAYWDPALGKKDGQPDWSCCVIIGRDQRGYFYAVDAYIAQHDGVDKQLDGVADLLWRWEIASMGIETNGFQSLLPSQLREVIARKAMAEGQPDWAVQILEVTNTRAKPLRISTLQPMVANGWLRFNARLHPEFFRQFRVFQPIPDFDKDDAPDAVEGCLRVLRGQLKKRDAF